MRHGDCLSGGVRDGARHDASCAGACIAKGPSVERQTRGAMQQIKKNRRMLTFMEERHPPNQAKAMRSTVFARRVVGSSAGRRRGLRGCNITQIPVPTVFPT